MLCLYANLFYRHSGARKHRNHISESGVIGLATIDYRSRVHRRRAIRKRNRNRRFRWFAKRVLACFVILAMVISGTKMPVAYAYFTATHQSDATSLTIVGVKCCKASAHFLDQHLINENIRVQSKVRGMDALQPVTAKETISAVVTLEGDFMVDEIDISTVGLHYGGETVSPLTGTIRGGDLVLEFDRAQIISWFSDQPRTPDAVTFDVTGEGGADLMHQFVFTGLATIRLTGTYETTAVGIDGPRAHLIPEGDKAATGTYHLVNQSGTVLDAVWRLDSPAAGVALDAGTGEITVEAAAVPGPVTIVAEFARSDGVHTTQKTVSLLADPHLAITGPASITVGDGPQQYKIQTRNKPVLENISWRVAGAAADVSVDGNGLVSVSEEARAGTFTLLVEAELKGLPLSADTTVTLAEPAPAVVELPAPEEEPAEEEQPRPEVVLPANTIVIDGEDLVLIPSDTDEAEFTYTAADRDGNPLTGVTWSLKEVPDGVSFDAAKGVLTVSHEAPEEMLTLEALLEVQKDTGEDTTVFSGSKNIMLAHPAPVAVRITGPENITLPGADAARQSFNFAAAVVDQKGNTLRGHELAWSLAEEIRGVTINSDGVLTITGEAVPGTVTIIVTAGEITGTLTVVLTETDAKDENPEDIDKNDEDPENPVAGGGEVPDDPPIREEEPAEPGDIDKGDNPDGDDDPGVEPDEDEDPADKPDEPGEEPGDKSDDPGVEPGDDADDTPGVEPDQPGDETGGPGNEMTDPKDDSPGESDETSDGEAEGKTDDTGGESGGDTDTGTGEGTTDADSAGGTDTGGGPDSGSGDAGSGDSGADSGSGSGSDGGSSGGDGGE